MRILWKRLESLPGGGGASGSMKFIADSVDDMWLVFSCLGVGDRVHASSTRKITRTDAVSGGTERVHVHLRIAVTTEPTFDPDSGTVRVCGRNVSESEHVRMHAFHAFNLTPTIPIEIEKDVWAQPQIDQLVDAGSGGDAEVVACIMDSGLAHVCCIGAHTTVMKAKVEVTVAKKRAGAAAHASTLARFFDSVLESLRRHVDWSSVRVLILASPGFIKDDFYTHLAAAAASRDDCRTIKANLHKIVRAHASSGFRSALRGVFADPLVAERISGTRIAGEVSSLDDFSTLLRTEPGRAPYGFTHVRVAADRAAIQRLMIADTLFRSRDTPSRMLYSALMQDVRNSGGVVQVFSSMHVSGEQLAQMGGLAACLWYAIEDLDAAAAAYTGPVPIALAAAAAAAGDGEADVDGDAGAGQRFDYDDSDDSSDSDASYKHPDRDAAGAAAPAAATAAKR